MLTANLKVGKQVGFGDAIRAPDFHRRDFAFVQQLVPRFGADSQGIAHLLDVHHIGILAQHYTVGIALVKSFAAYTDAENDVRHLLEQRRHKIIAQLLRILRNRHCLGKSVVYFRVLGCKAHRIGCNRVTEIVAQFSVVIKAELKAPFLAAAKKVVQHLQSFIVCHRFDCTAQIGKLRQKVDLHLPQTAAGIGNILFVGG